MHIAYKVAIEKDISWLHDRRDHKKHKYYVEDTQAVNLICIPRYCCSPSSYDRVSIPCDGYDMVVYLVTSCGCYQCAEPPLVYAGVAMTSNGDRLMYVYTA